MMHIEKDIQVYLYRDHVDFRKQINGLSLLVQEQMELDLLSSALFVFTNRNKSCIKILWWQKNGFCLWLKRLEKDRFQWPKKLTEENVSINGEELTWLLEGFDIWNKPPHQELYYREV